MLMDATKLVNLVLPKEVFGNYWIVNDKKENLVSVQAIENNWVLKSNSEVKVFRNGTAVEEALLEEEKFYTLKNILLGEKTQIPPCINAYSEKLPKFAISVQVLGPHTHKLAALVSTEIRNYNYI